MSSTKRKPKANSPTDVVSDRDVDEMLRFARRAIELLAAIMHPIHPKMTAGELVQMDDLMREYDQVTQRLMALFASWTMRTKGELPWRVSQTLRMAVTLNLHGLDPVDDLEDIKDRVDAENTLKRLESRMDHGASSRRGRR